MRFFKQQTLPVVFMISSMLLLTFFQVFWLKEVYRDQFELLKKETDYLFLKSMGILQDSLIDKVVIKHFEYAPKDSIRLDISNGKRFLSYRGEIDSNQLSSFHISDSVKESGEDFNALVRISERITAGTKPIQDSLAISISKDVGTTQQNQVIALWITDTLAPKQIQATFSKALDTENIDLEFNLLALTSKEEYGNTEGLTTSTIFSHGNQKLYAASFPKFSWYLAKRMAPQIFFSILLLSVTFVSFYLIYSNLLKQRRLTRIKNDFVSNITHELKTPITTVGVALEALSNFDVLKQPTKTAEYLDISKSELNRLTLLVDKVLKMSVFEQDEPQLKIESLDLEALMEEILNSLKVQFEQLSAKINFRAIGHDFKLQADKIHLTNVIYNLLDNALKYTRQNPLINISLKNEADCLTLSIEDNGIGIPINYREKIFDKFFRVPSGNQHNTRGYGLGLSYVAGVVQQHKGNIRVESEQDRGSRFIIKLPRHHEFN